MDKQIKFALTGIILSFVSEIVLILFHIDPIIWILPPFFILIFIFIIIAVLLEKRNIRIHKEVAIPTFNDYIDTYQYIGSSDVDKELLLESKFANRIHDFLEGGYSHQINGVYKGVPIQIAEYYITYNDESISIGKTISGLYIKLIKKQEIDMAINTYSGDDISKLNLPQKVKEVLKRHFDEISNGYLLQVPKVMVSIQEDYISLFIDLYKPISNMYANKNYREEIQNVISEIDFLLELSKTI